MEGCTNASALTREIRRLGYHGDVNTVRRHQKPYRNGAIPATAPLPHLTVRRVTDWIMRRPERLTDVERKALDELCERNPALATTRGLRPGSGVACWWRGHTSRYGGGCTQAVGVALRLRWRVHSAQARTGCCPATSRFQSAAASVSWAVSLRMSGAGRA
ncbi:hypothetical protein [Streptomyces albipurpureus]|uniref:Transposase n=1 Tax=Streptomyces albipurpureus TaxID=2897419 RepID=A0ABT0UQF0_9ACTN|nr:hypothetical protein [Streptomyces sp. CWNU-1]MCM2389471.1 hypothetical protein [Streptomyces sp. CWNU-1]